VKIIRGDFNMTKSLKEKKRRICRLDGICTRIVDNIEDIQLMNPPIVMETILGIAREEESIIW
jgi:hypothetical protein